MALESKPLFHPEVLRQQVRAFNLPERMGDWQPKLQEWAPLIASGRADDFKETALLPDFLAHIFCGLLRYTGPVGPADPHNSHNSHNSHLSGTGPAESPDTFTFSRERHVQVHGKVPDAVLGRFQKDKAQFVMGPMPAGTSPPTTAASSPPIRRWTPSRCPTRSAPISRTLAITITGPRAKWPTRTRTPKSARSLIWMNALNEPQRKALIRFWEAWPETLKQRANP
jgi:hypothetical protein